MLPWYLSKKHLNSFATLPTKRNPYPYFFVWDSNFQIRLNCASPTPYKYSCWLILLTHLLCRGLMGWGKAVHRGWEGINSRQVWALKVLSCNLLLTTPSDIPPARSSLALSPLVPYREIEFSFPQPTHTCACRETTVTHLQPAPLPPISMQVASCVLT